MIDYFSLGIVQNPMVSIRLRDVDPDRGLGGDAHLRASGHPPHHLQPPALPPTLHHDQIHPHQLPVLHAQGRHVSTHCRASKWMAIILGLSAAR